jgi:hypothetical protein
MASRDVLHRPGREIADRTDGPYAERPVALFWRIFGYWARLKPPRPPHFGAIWPAASLFGLSVRLADGVVPWHTFNLVGFGPVNFQACHSKYQSSRCQAETLSLYRCGIDLLG